MGTKPFSLSPTLNFLLVLCDIKFPVDFLEKREEQCLFGRSEINLYIAHSADIIDDKMYFET